MSSRPEVVGPPELFYDETESKKYTTNSHIVQIQSEMAERALELLALPEDQPSILLDVGCGSGLSGEVLTENEHHWIGIDISRHMLKVAKEDNESDGDLILKDIGTGIPIRPGVIDGAISISAIQWLCHANSNKENPRKRLLFFFQSLYACLARGARAVFQFYPQNAAQSELITEQATKAGFNGGLVVDFPNSTKAKKIYLVLMTGGIQNLPKALTDENESRSRVEVIDRRNHGNMSSRNLKGSRSYIEAKKERLRRKGRDVKPTTKYTGRKRRH
uniref:18S rRNA (guanine-N(7))-methyltransferase n=1 Tax=Acrobeloides nanus TaxID=290746 RepID=A0A914E6G4_9BILA